MNSKFETVNHLMIRLLIKDYEEHLDAANDRVHISMRQEDYVSAECDIDLIVELKLLIAKLKEVLDYERHTFYDKENTLTFGITGNRFQESYVTEPIER